MSEDPRARQFIDSLTQALARLEDDPRAAASARRVARSVAGSDGIPASVRAVARTALAAGPQALGASVEALIQALAGALADPKGGGSGRIAVIVEADSAKASAMGEALEAVGFEVRRVSGAIGVPEFLHRSPADLLVVDIFLPDKDGRDLILEVSQAPRTARLPIIALSHAEGRVALARSECLALGADVFLEGPGEVSRLAAEATRLVTDQQGEAMREPEGAGVLRRARFDDAYRGRPTDTNGGVLALVAFDAFRELSEQRGLDTADAALGEVARELRERLPEVTAVGRWAPFELGLLLPGLAEGEAAERLRGALADLRDHAWETVGAATLVDQVSGSVVPTPPGASLADRMQAASLVRLGLAYEGTRILTNDVADVGRRTILLVEDDLLDRALVEHKLRHAGFDLSVYEDGDQAARDIPSLDFDLAVLDINLPGRDGFQLLRLIRDLDAGRRRPILILSGLGSEEAIVRGLRLGADDYMIKPFSPKELTARVRRLLAGTRAGAE